MLTGSFCTVPNPGAQPQAPPPSLPPRCPPGFPHLPCCPSEQRPNSPRVLCRRLAGCHTAPREGSQTRQGRGSPGSSAPQVSTGEHSLTSPHSPLIQKSPGWRHGLDGPGWGSRTGSNVSGHPQGARSLGSPGEQCLFITAESAALGPGLRRSRRLTESFVPLSKAPDAPNPPTARPAFRLLAQNLSPACGAWRRRKLPLTWEVAFGDQNGGFPGWMLGRGR